MSDPFNAIQYSRNHDDFVLTFSRYFATFGVTNALHWPCVFCKLTMRFPFIAYLAMRNISIQAFKRRLEKKNCWIIFLLSFGYFFVLVLLLNWPCNRRLGSKLEPHGASCWKTKKNHYPSMVMQYPILFCNIFCNV